MTRLIGSEKQIRWAEDIRKTVMDHYSSEIDEYNETIAEAMEDNDQEWADRIAIKRDLVVEMCEVLETVTSAGWWIDMRGRDCANEYKWFKKYGTGAFKLAN